MRWRIDYRLRRECEAIGSTLDGVLEVSLDAIHRMRD